MTQPPFAIVGFDLDGTLLDTSRDLGAAVNHVMELIGRDRVPDAEISGLIGGGSRLMLRKALALTGGYEGYDVEELYKPLLAFYEANIARHTALYPGGAEMLDALEEVGVRLALVTNKPQHLADKLLHELGLHHRFGCVIGGGAGYPLKPAPDVLRAMVERLGGGRAAYVGDSTFDTRAARAAQMPCIAVGFGFNDLPPQELGADAVIDHFDELAPALENLRKLAI